VAHVAALPGNPYDGHTLATVVPAIAQQIGASLTKLITDAGYRGHTSPQVKGLRVYTSGQKRGVTDQIKRELRRRPAVEPVIGHLKEEHRLGRNYLAGKAGDATNAILAAVG
jgi:IS5 family transposase